MRFDNYFGRDALMTTELRVRDLLSRGSWYRDSFSVARPPASAGSKPREVDLLPPPSLIPPGSLRNTLLPVEARRTLRASA